MAAFADDPKAGETWHVSTEKLALRERPDGLSPAIASLKYNDAAEIVTTTCPHCGKSILSQNGELSV